MPDRRTAGIAERGRGWAVQGGAAVLLSFATMALLAGAGARELPAPGAEPPETSIAVADTSSGAEETIGVDIRIADLMADGSELSGVAPRMATSGIGSDVDRDLFSDGTPLNAPTAPATDDEQQYLY